MNPNGIYQTELRLLLFWALFPMVTTLLLNFKHTLKNSSTLGGQTWGQQIDFLEMTPDQSQIILGVIRDHQGSSGTIPDASLMIPTIFKNRQKINIFIIKSSWIDPVGPGGECFAPLSSSQEEFPKLSGIKCKSNSCEIHDRDCLS